MEILKKLVQKRIFFIKNSNLFAYDLGSLLFVAKILEPNSKQFGTFGKICGKNFEFIRYAYS